MNMRRIWPITRTSEVAAATEVKNASPRMSQPGRELRMVERRPVPLKPNPCSSDYRGPPHPALSRKRGRPSRPHWQTRSMVTPCDCQLFSLSPRERAGGEGEGIIQLHKLGKTGHANCRALFRWVELRHV